MPNKFFLENYPLYSKANTDWMNSFNNIKLNKLPKPAIHMHCDVCASEQTFNVENDYEESEGNYNIEGKIIRAKYICSSCAKGERLFIVRLFNRIEKTTDSKGGEVEYTYVSMEKIGQYPSWNIQMDSELEKMLGKHSDYYKKGLTCESQSYGIGAYAYFRRITEDIIDELINSIFDLVEGEEKKEEYRTALKKVKETKITEKKIDVVKDLLPVSLQTEGINPLKALHSALSAGLHGKTDEECMEQAEIIRSILVFLVNQTMKTKEEKKKFTSGIKKLLSK
ncbi:hypothetical protein KAI65_03980 [Candidatus Parcubacteria bacterium]|nr:hypothetical protein [Candidatus Parcubacteria bacterium]